MAEEVINIATFEFDVDKLQASLSSLQDTMFALRKEQEGYVNHSKEVKKATEALVKEQLRLAASGQELSDEYKENDKLLQDLSKSEQQLYKNQQNTANSMARVRTELTATNKELNAYMTSQAKQTTLIEAGNAALGREINNKNQAKAANIELNRISNQLNPSIKEEAELLKLVNAQIDKNTDYIKANSSESAKQKLNIGNYTESIKKAITESKLFGSVLDNLPAPFQRAAIGFKSVNESISEVKNAYKDFYSGLSEARKAQEDFNSLTKIATQTTEQAKVAEEARIAIGFKMNQGLATQAELEIATATATTTATAAQNAQTAATEAGVIATNASSTALKLFKVALISTGIGAIVVVLGSFIAYLTTAQDGIGKLTAITRPLQAIFQGLLGLLSNLGRTLIETFENPKKALSDLGDFVKNNLINRFKAFGVILEGIMDLDFKKVLNGAAQAASGVENVIDKVQAGAAEANKFLVEQAKLGAEVDRITKQMEASQLAFNAAQVAVGDALDKNNLIIKDTSKSFRERAAAAKENIAIAEANGQAEAKILELELQRLKVQQQIKGIQNLTNADKQEEIDLLVKIDDAEDKGLEKRLEYSRVLSGLEKERQDAAKKARDEQIALVKKQQEAAIKAMQTELDIYIASQGDKKKSLEEQLKFSEEVMKQEIAIAQAEYDAKKLTLREFELEKIEITNEFLSRQTEAVIANGEIELELFRLHNQRRIEENQFYNEELYRQDLDRINRLAEEESNLQTQRFAAGLIGIEEYNLAIAQIDENQRVANEAAEQERKDAKKEKEAIDVAIQSELNAEAFEYSLQLQMEQYQREYDQRKAIAVANGADMIKFEENEAKKKKLIERTVTDNKLELAQTTFGTIASILGKESAAGKAAGVAQTTVETYRGAQAAFTGMTEAIPGPVGIALGVVAAAGAVAAGLANVKKILAVKPATVEGGAPRPKYASGVIRLAGIGSGTSDSLDANVSAGESIITARATQMFPQLLSQINQAGGGVGIDGNTSQILQNNISQRADNSQMAEAIANAVRTGAALGTAEGAAKGIVDLSDNRQIMADAKF